MKRTTLPGAWALPITLLLILGLTACQQSPTTPPDAPEGSQETSLLPLPTFDDCAQDHPTLPARWQAVALMQDFFLNHLTFGDFTYDESAAAFRFRLADRYGTDLDFLVTEDRTLYLLEEKGGDLICRLETKESPFTVPTRDWLDPGAECVGQAPILERQQMWWKTPSGVGANWFWFNSDNGLPFRSMYYVDAPLTQPVPIYEHFTFNYFPTFEAVDSTDLTELVALCESSAGAPSGTSYGLDFAKSLAASTSYPEPNADTIARAQEWIPGLSECSSLDDLPPPWPHQVQATVFMTAVSFPPNPFPTRVFYDWDQKAQNSSLYYDPPTPTDYVQEALLTGDTGYISIQDKEGKVSMCAQALPGPQVPDWQKVDGCECRAQIAPKTVLNPSDTPTKILWCPTDLSAKQVFWTWYSDTGTPVVFMQSNSSPTDGTGLNLADYYHWLPGSKAPEGTFDIPEACLGQPKVDVPPACHNCHLPTNSGAG